MTVAEVLIDTRLAADTVSPTKMDRPEDIEVNPVNGRVYCALTNNSNRDTEAETDEANPLWQSQTRPSLGAPLVTQNGNRNGYVLEMEPANDNHAGRSFFWRLMLVCGDPRAPETYFAGYPKEQVSPISCPDNVAFDPDGNLWISTDGNVLGSNDGLFRVPTRGPERGKVQQFATVPFGAEACGPFIHPRREVGVPRAAAPGRDRRRDVREPDQRLARPQRLPPAVGGGGLREVTRWRCPAAYGVRGTSAVPPPGQNLRFPGGAAAGMRMNPRLPGDSCTHAQASSSAITASGTSKLA